MKKWLPFIKIDICTIMSELFIKNVMLFFLIYKSCNLLNYAWVNNMFNEYLNI